MKQLQWNRALVSSRMRQAFYATFQMQCLAWDLGLLSVSFFRLFIHICECNRQQWCRTECTSHLQAKCPQHILELKYQSCSGMSNILILGAIAVRKCLYSFSVFFFLFFFRHMVREKYFVILYPGECSYWVAKLTNVIGNKQDVVKNYK